MRTGTEVPRVQSVVAVRDEEARAAIPAARVGEAGKGPPTGVPGGGPLLSGHPGGLAIQVKGQSSVPSGPAAG